MQPLWADCKHPETVLQRIQRRHSLVGITGHHTTVDITDLKLNHMSVSCPDLVVHRPEMDQHSREDISASSKESISSTGINIHNSNMADSISSCLNDSMSLSSHKAYLYLTPDFDDMEYDS